MLTLVNRIVVINSTTWATFNSKLEKIKKFHPEKKFIYFRNWTFQTPQKNLIKLFYYLNKSSSGETGCLSNLYYLLAAEGSSFLVHLPFPNTVSQDTIGTLPLTLQYLCVCVCFFTSKCFTQFYIQQDNIKKLTKKAYNNKQQHKNKTLFTFENHKD